MRRTMLWTCGVLAFLAFLSAERAWGLGTETIGNEPLHEANYTEWKGIMPVINDKTRVYSNWVNGNERFFYKSTTKELNAALVEFARIEVEGLPAGKSTVHEVLLRPGPGITQTFDRKEIPFHWELHIHGGISKHLLTLDKGDEVWNRDPRLTIYVGGDFDLAKLEIPKGVTLLDIPTLSKRVAAGIAASKDKTVRGWGCGQLTSLDHFSADNMQAVAKMLDDEDSWVRLNAAGSLPLFGKKAAPHLPALRECLVSEDRGLKTRAQAAIVEIEQAEDKTKEEKESTAGQKAIAQFLEARKDSPK
ncbi:MAG: HEAT repeat domain-containing protein [Pirellulaceae bacterium]